MRDQPIDDEASLRFRLATLAVGDDVPVQVIRGGKEVTLDVQLAAPPEEPPRERSALDGRQPLSGATVVNMSPAVADEMGLAEWRPGVAVVEVQPGSYAGALPAAGRHDPGDQRPGREERRRPQEAHRRRRLERLASAAKAWYPPSSSAEAW